MSKQSNDIMDKTIELMAQSRLSSEIYKRDLKQNDTVDNIVKSCKEAEIILEKKQDELLLLLSKETSV